MKSEFGWVRYCSCNIGCLNNSENRITKMKGSFTGLISVKDVFWAGWAIILLGPIVRCWTQKAYEPSSARGKGTGRRPFSLCRHGRGLELSELGRNGAPGLRSRSGGHGEREESEEILFRGLRAWERVWKVVRDGRPWLRSRELVGSSARATTGLGAAWER